MGSSHWGAGGRAQGTPWMPRRARANAAAPGGCGSARRPRREAEEGPCCAVPCSFICADQTTTTESTLTVVTISDQINLTESTKIVVAILVQGNAVWHRSIHSWLHCEQSSSQRPRQTRADSCFRFLQSFVAELSVAGRTAGCWRGCCYSFCP